MEISAGTLRQTLIVTLSVFAFLPGQAAPQEPPLAFPTEVEQVTVDVVVTDGEGQPLTDLVEADVEVYEDGVLQATRSFGVFEAAPLPAEETEGAGSPEPLAVRDRVSSNTDAEELKGRTLVGVAGAGERGVRHGPLRRAGPRAEADR